MQPRKIFYMYSSNDEVSDTFTREFRFEGSDLKVYDSASSNAVRLFT